MYSSNQTIWHYKTQQPVKNNDLEYAIQVYGGKTCHFIDTISGMIWGMKPEHTVKEAKRLLALNKITVAHPYDPQQVKRYNDNLRHYYADDKIFRTILEAEEQELD